MGPCRAGQQSQADDLHPPPHPRHRALHTSRLRHVLNTASSEQLRRSIAMLQPGSLAMKREDAMRLLSELGEVRGRLDQLRHGLLALLGEEDR